MGKLKEHYIALLEDLQFSTYEREWVREAPDTMTAALHLWRTLAH
jgi:hypothetical protein